MIPSKRQVITNFASLQAACKYSANASVKNLSASQRFPSRPKSTGRNCRPLPPKLLVPPISPETGNFALPAGLRAIAPPPPHPIRPGIRYVSWHLLRHNNDSKPLGYKDADKVKGTSIGRNHKYISMEKISISPGMIKNPGAVLTSNSAFNLPGYPGAGIQLASRAPEPPPPTSTRRPANESPL